MPLASGVGPWCGRYNVAMLFRALPFVLLSAPLCQAAVNWIEIQERTNVLDGAAFGAAGPYERIVAKAHFAVDPKLPANRIIADIDLAPRNADGKVEFSADLYILEPRDSGKANGTALVEISNRGGKGLLSLFDFGTASRDPRTAAEFGDDFLLQQGFALVWIGWEFDVPPAAHALRLETPIVTEHSRTIQGLVRSEWIGDERVMQIPLGDRNQIGYPVADPADPANRLTVRDRVNGQRETIPRSQWTFVDATHAGMASGFTPGRIYEVIYKAKDPVVVGLGPAAIRDMVSFLKNGGVETALGDQRGYAKRTLGVGVSQSGRFLRTFLYDGFNADEQDRRVFDGVWAHVAGAGRGSFNFRFAQPSRDGHSFTNVFYPVDLPPFTDQDGLLAKASKDGVTPKIFYSNGSYEYYGRAASLIHTAPDGKSDEPPSKDTRIYSLAGSQHGAGSIPPRSVPAQNPAGANDYRCAMRALLVAMQAWLKDEKDPPASQYPKIGKDQLVALSALAFPKIPGVAIPTRKREAYRLDFSTEPPKVGPAFPTLVPQVNADGNETSGIRMPEIQVPLASYTGWNLRDPKIGAPDELFTFTGSWIRFPLTQAERGSRGDPRLSIEERYRGKQDYLDKIDAASHDLVRQGFLLDRDVERIHDRAAKEWDYVLRSN
jgi:hypothetical protein